ncbi:MAG: type II secretion system F family protein [Gammaproteobacteria bacterium]|nr:type II secretion system F family protein [Gammaproteobacteria bacterium]MDH5515520.1 type II secretion system F family protein [Gammaproteobacteria bacterium]
MPLEITAVQQAARTKKKPAKSAARKSGSRRKPGMRDRIFFTEQLSLLLETGTPLHAALQALASQMDNPAMREIIDGLNEHVTSGKSFSYALAQFPELFPVAYINLVAAAENGGFMDKVLLELMNMDEKRDELRRTVTAALSYPGFLVVFSVFVVIFVLVAVFPKFADMFAAIADRLPVTTIMLMNASHVLITYWIPITAGLVASIVALAWWLRTAAGQAALDSLKLRVFGVKDIFIQVYLIQSMRVLGLSLDKGVSVPDALASCREVVSNRDFRKFLTSVEVKVNEGGGFAAAFQEVDFIPPMVRQMVTTGEETGNLPKVLGRVADYYERELARKLAAFSRMVEPIMLIVMGAVVGLIVSSLILPIFKLSQAVG